MDSAPTIEIPLPSEHPGREDPSPASRDPLNSLICALLDPYHTIEEIAENRRITVMRLGEILAGEPASSTIEALRKVFALRAELLALHARASAVGTLTRIANSGKDDEVARRAATTLLRMFRPDGSPAPQPRANRTGSVSDRANTPDIPPRPSAAEPRREQPAPAPHSRDDLAHDSERSGSSSPSVSNRTGSVSDRANTRDTPPRPSGSGLHPAPSSRDDSGGGHVRAADDVRAPDRGFERSGLPPATPAMRTSLRGCAASSEIAGSLPLSQTCLDDPNGVATVSGRAACERPTPLADIPATSIPARAAPTPPTAPAERGPEGRQPLRKADLRHPQSSRVDSSGARVTNDRNRHVTQACPQQAILSGRAAQHQPHQLNQRPPPSITAKKKKGASSRSRPLPLFRSVHQCLMPDA